MALKDYAIRREDIALPGGNSFNIGPISLAVAVTLLVSRKDEVKAAFDMLKDKGLTDEPDPYLIGMALIEFAPGIVNEAIAHAANEPGAAAQVAQLPIGVQLEAIEKMFELTFEAEGGVKKFGETLVRLVQKATQAFQTVNTL